MLGEAEFSSLLDAMRAELSGDPAYFLSPPKSYDGLSVEQAAELLRLAPLEPAATEPALRRAGALILFVVSANPTPAHLPVLREVMPSLLPEARAEAIRVAGQIPDAGSIDFMLDALEQYLPDGIDPGWSGVLYWLERSPRHPERLFPRLLQLANDKEIRSEIDHVVAAYLAAGLVGDGELAQAPRAFKSMVRRLSAARVRIEKRSAAERLPERGPWWRERAYQESRENIASLITSMSFLVDDRAREAIEWVSAIGDPRLTLAAIEGPLRRGEPVSQELIVAVAGESQTRVALWTSLQGAGRTELFPKSEFRREAFAESAMTTWLCWFTELGRPPVDIKLAAEVGLKFRDTDATAYLFEFMPDGKRAKWTAGVVGPYEIDDAPDAEPGFAFSDFAAIDSAQPEEHVARVLAAVTSVAQ